MNKSNDTGATLKDCAAYYNGGDGLRIESNVKVNVERFEAVGNGGEGINIAPALAIRVKKPSRLKRVGILLGTVGQAAVAAALGNIVSR